MKIYVHRTHTIMDGLVIRWRVWPSLMEQQINASRDGVHVHGYWILADDEQRKLFEQTLAEAWRCHISLRGGLNPLRRENEIDVPFGRSFEGVMLEMEKAHG